MLGGLFGARGTQSATVTQNQIVIAAPDGFCVDTTATQNELTTGFVLFGSCAAITGNTRAASPAAPAILTASVGDNPGTAVATRLAEMDAFLRSDAGRAALSRSGTSDTVEVLDSFAQDDVLYLRARDTSPARDPEMAPEYWRAFFDAKGALITLSVVGTRSAPMPPQTGLDVLQDFTRIVRSRNGVITAPPPVATAPAQSAPPPAAAPAPPVPVWGGLGNVGLFRRLLG